MASKAETTHGSSMQADEDLLLCHWRLNATSSPESSVRTLDILLHLPDARPDLDSSWSVCEIDTQRILDPKIANFVADVFETSSVGALKVLLPAKDGYWVRTNLITQRLAGCTTAGLVVDFAKCKQHYAVPKSAPINDASSLWSLMSHAVGAVQVKPSSEMTDVLPAFSLLESEIANRLSLPLLISEPSRARRLALVHGRTNWIVGQMIYQAAKELGIEIFVLDQEGHWIQHGKHQHMRKDFIPIDMTNDAGLPTRIVKAVQEYPLAMDGLTTFTDTLLIPVAQAALELGFPATQPSILETCRDKYLTRMIRPLPDLQCHKVIGFDGAVDLLKDRTIADNLTYPLIVKPCAGYGSEGVVKVHNEAQLLQAAKNANKTDYGRGSQVTIETYVSGPEVDANFVLWNDEVLFFEVADQFPAEADLDGAVASANFLELDLCLPSGLPPSEQDNIKQTLLEILQELGCHNGVFHMEARVKGSRMEYRISDGLLDLETRRNAPSGDPSTVIIENNCRPPNHVCVAATTHTHGVDYFALHMLVALRDEFRIRALSQSYRVGAQCHLDCVMLPVTRGGFFASKDPIGDLQSRRPELMQSVVKSEMLFKFGDQIPDPSTGVLTWFGYLLVAAAERKELLTTVSEIRKEMRLTVADCSVSGSQRTVLVPAQQMLAPSSPHQIAAS